MPREASSFDMHSLIKFDLSKCNAVRAFSIATYSFLLIEKAVAVWSGLRSFFMRAGILHNRQKMQVFFLCIDK